MLKTVLKIIAILGITAGLYGAAVVSFETISGEKACPKVFGIYACYIVLIGYLWMLISILLPIVNLKLKIISFLIGWLPVFLLAAIASGIELVSSNICPQSEAGIPLCFISLGLSVFVLGSFLMSTVLIKKH